MNMIVCFLGLGFAIAGMIALIINALEDASKGSVPAFLLSLVYIFGLIVCGWLFIIIANSPATGIVVFSNPFIR